MGLRKKLATTFTRRTNSRRDKRKEQSKREKTQFGSGVSIADFYDDTHERNDGKESAVPRSETHITSRRRNDDDDDADKKEHDNAHVYSSEARIPGLSYGKLNQQRPRTARVLTYPGNLPAPARTQTRVMRYSEDEDSSDDEDAVMAFSLSSSSSSLSSSSSSSVSSLTSLSSNGSLSSTTRVTIISPYTPRWSRMDLSERPPPPKVYSRGTLSGSKFIDDLTVIDLEEYPDDVDDNVKLYIPKSRAPPPSDECFMYKKVVKNPFKNHEEIIDLRPTSSSLSLVSSHTVFDWPTSTKKNVLCVVPLKTPELGYAYQDDKAKPRFVTEGLHNYKTAREQNTQSRLHNLTMDAPSKTANVASRNTQSRLQKSAINAPSQSASVASSVADKGQTAEEYLRNLNENKTSWNKEDQINLKGEKRIRRKLYDGAYPTYTILEDKLSRLMRFAWKGKHEKLRRYLRDESKHCKANRVDHCGRTALHYAASWADYRMIKILLEIHCIDLNVKDNHDKTPLFIAIDMKSLACVRLLVQAGARARTTCRDERNALEYAITKYGDECFGIIEYLYNGRGIRDTDLGNNHMTLLHQSVVTKKHVTNVKVIQMILESGLVDFDEVEGNGRSPLILAAKAQRPDLVYTLLKHGADPNHYDNYTKNAIRYAKDGSECMKILQGFKSHPITGKKTFKYRPSDQLAPIQAVNTDNKVTKNEERGSKQVNGQKEGPSKQVIGKKEGPFNMNPKMDDPEYRDHITNLFLASKFKAKEDIYYDPMSI